MKIGAIQKGIPVQENVAGKFKQKYPFVDLTPGDFVQLDECVNVVAVQRAAHQVAHLKGWKVRTRTNGGSLRVWRVA